MTSSSGSSALMQDREKFLKRQADATSFRSNTEKRMKTEKSTQPKANRPKQNSSRAQTSDSNNDYPLTISGRPRPQILQMIVDKLKERFLEGNSDPLTIEEIANETNLTFAASDRHWLVTGPLLSNERIDVKNIDDVNKFVYKPPLELTGKKRDALLHLLKSRHKECEAAVYVEDVRNSMPRNPAKKGSTADKIIETLIKDGEIVKFIGSNKREVLFYADRPYKLNVHQDFIEGWRAVSVDGKTQEEIMEELNREGHRGLVSNRPRMLATKASKPTKRGGRRGESLKFNQHVADQLVDYSNVTIKK